MDVCYHEPFFFPLPSQDFFFFLETRDTRLDNIAKGKYAEYGTFN